VLTGAATAPPYKPTDGTDLATLAINAAAPAADAGAPDAGPDASDESASGEPPSTTLRGTLEHLHLWNGLADPYVYQVRVILRDGDTVVDSVQQPFGFRDAKFDVDNGFLLNGQKYPLRGVCMHQDHHDRGGRFDMSDTTTPAATGVGKPTIDHDFELLNEIGLNFVRFAHYQHSDYTYQKADQAGIVAWAENAFVNRIPLPATRAFQQNTNKQYAELIKQNFNHPSIVMWSMSNEILMKAGPSPLGVEKSLNVVAKKLDPNRTSCSAANGGQEDNDADWQGDVAAFNEYQGWYERTTAAFATWADGSRTYQQASRPGQAIGLSEYGAGANPDPAYTHELPIVERPGDRTGGWQTEEYQAHYHEVYYKKIAKSPWLVLTSVWNMFDFASDYRNEGNLRGENTKGLVTYDRSVKKDAFYMYKAQWNKSEPFVYINSRRYAGLAQVVNEVKVYSNQSPVTLTLNGAAVGTISDDDIKTADGTPHVFLFKGIQWAAGDNVVVATAGNVSDTVTWTR
jgi:beta-galactosidase